MAFQMESAAGEVAAVENARAVDPGLDAKIAFLRGQPGCEAIETHLSWVFLIGAQAYKLKKPVRYHATDFATLERRRLACLEEVRLNRRLAPDVYLGSLPLTIDEDRSLVMAGAGPVVDWLVAMRRLPARRMLDRRLAEGTLTHHEVSQAGVVLASFYLGQRPERLPTTVYAERLVRAILTDRAALLSPVYGLPRETIERSARAQLDAVRDLGELLEERVRAGCLCEGHGDLRPEHVCLEPTPVVIDCLDIDAEWRVVDAVADLAFLALECERLGAPAVGMRFIAIYAALTGDRPPSALLRFYRARHAMTRAKIAAWHLDDPLVREPARWKALSERYLDLGDRPGPALSP